jgi:pantoate kinase
MVSRGARRAVAFAPGHVTGLFVPSTGSADLAARGSRGAGLVLEVGVTASATFRPGAARRLDVRGEGRRPLSISSAVARRLAPTESGRLSVRLRHDLPIGQGFGMSAAGALATALAVARVARRTRSEAVRTAHEEDLLGGGGLGGVAAILGGGLELRRRPGLPPIGRVDHRSFPDPIWVAVVGRPISTRAALADLALRMRIERAAAPLDDLLRAPSRDRFLTASERFTDDLALASRPLHDALRALRRRGAFAAQAMFGESFFAVARSPAHRREIVRWLSTASFRGVEVRAARRGASARAQPF